MWRQNQFKEIHKPQRGLSITVKIGEGLQTNPKIGHGFNGPIIRPTPTKPGRNQQGLKNSTNRG